MNLYRKITHTLIELCSARIRNVRLQIAKRQDQTNFEDDGRLCQRRQISRGVNEWSDFITIHHKNLHVSCEYWKYHAHIYLFICLKFWHESIRPRISALFYFTTFGGSVALNDPHLLLIFRINNASSVDRDNRSNNVIRVPSLPTSKWKLKIWFASPWIIIQRFDENNQNDELMCESYSNKFFHFISFYTYVPSTNMMNSDPEESYEQLIYMFYIDIKNLRFSVDEIRIRWGQLELCDDLACPAWSNWVL